MINSYKQHTYFYTGLIVLKTPKYTIYKTGISVTLTAVLNGFFRDLAKQNLF